MNSKTAGRIDILLVEDSPTDAMFAREAFEDSAIVKQLYIATDGVNAIEFLHQEGDYSNAPRPDLILLDLNLPKKDGREVLAEIKADRFLRRIPVIVLTTSSSEADILKAYDLHANCYIVKPLDFSRFSEVVTNIENFWFSVVKLPGDY